jgi:hypothetical protein
MNETKRKAIETQETNNLMVKAKATILAPSLSFLPQNTVYPLIGNLYNCPISESNIRGIWTFIQFLVERNSLNTYTPSIKTT